MKPFHRAFVFVVVAVCSLYLGLPERPGNIEGGAGVGHQRGTELKLTRTVVEASEAPEGPDLERWFFKRWHEPLDAVLEPSTLNSILGEVQRLPSEPAMVTSSQSPSGPAAVNSWTSIGPYGMRNVSNAGTEYSGRILDIAPPQDGATTRIAAASGGLWQYFILVFLAIPVPMSDMISSLATSTFAAKPGDKNTIFVGTGEAWQRAGTGIWKTGDGGSSWVNVLPNSSTRAVYRIRYSPGSTNIIHAATEAGHLRSTDGGLTWSRKLSGDICDIAIDPTTPNNMYAAKWGDTLSGGLYWSTLSGDYWVKLAGGLPQTNVGRSAVSICSSNSNYVYVVMTRNDNNNFLGVFKTTNRGVSWTNVSPSASDIGGNGWYNAVIAVSPTDPNVVLAGMTSLMRSTNGGNSWAKISTPNLHPDQHAITWGTDGKQVWEGNDGGMSYSDDAGATWTTTANSFGITQYYGFEVSLSNPQVIFGGAQDNGLSGTTDGGTIWNHTLGGDGASIAINYSDASAIFAVNGAYGGSILFRRQKSGNSGQSWSDFNSGITADDNWAPKIRADRNSPPILYTNAQQYVYSAMSPYSSWNKLNATAFASKVANVTVSRSGVIFACLDSPGPGPRLEVYAGGLWAERSAGLAANVRVRTVAQHPRYDNIAYALMEGLGSPGEKIFRTTDYGQTWSNVTGDLPNVPVGGLVPHPGTLFGESPYLYLGTEFGCYLSSNGGTNWERWNNGMPNACIVTEMGYIDSLVYRIRGGGKFFVLASTFGRGIWKRDVSGTDPTAVAESGPLPEAFHLSQNYPNPFNPSTAIRITIPQEDELDLSVYDVTGRLVKVLVHQRMSAGTHSLTFDASGLASGVYVYRARTSRFDEAKKMIVLR